MLLPSIEALSDTKLASIVHFKIEKTQSSNPKQQYTKLQPQAPLA